MAGESETQSLPDSSEENLHLTQWRLSSHSITAVQSLGTGLVSLRTGGGFGTYSHSPKDEELSSFYVRFCGRLKRFSFILPSDINLKGHASVDYAIG